jgi:hypothetical protein
VHDFKTSGACKALLSVGLNRTPIVIMLQFYYDWRAELHLVQTITNSLTISLEMVDWQKLSKP